MLERGKCEVGREERREGGGGDVCYIKGSQEAPVAALPPLNNLAPRRCRGGWGAADEGQISKVEQQSLTLMIDLLQLH